LVLGGGMGVGPSKLPEDESKVRRGFINEWTWFGRDKRELLLARCGSPKHAQVDARNRMVDGRGESTENRGSSMAELQSDLEGSR